MAPMGIANNRPSKRCALRCVRRVRLAAVLLGLTASLFATAQPIKPFALTDVNGYLELGIKLENETRTRISADTSSEYDELEFREVLQLNTSGYVYHPRLLSFSLGGQVDYLQEELEITGFEDKEVEDVLLGGNVELRVFEMHSYGFSVYANSNEQDVEAVFAPSYTMSSEGWGGTIRLHNKFLPLRLSYDHSSLEGFGAGSDVNTVRDDFRVLGFYYLGDRSRGSLEYHTYEIDDKAFSRSSSRQDFLLDNTTYFGAEQQIVFDSYVRWDEQTNSADTSQFTVREDLRWQHRDNLKTNYSVSYSEIEHGTVASESWKARAVLEHRLYDSLMTNVSLGVQLDEYETSDVLSYGGVLLENYTKGLGEWGRFRVALTLGAHVVDSQAGQQRAYVRGERHTVPLGPPVELAKTGIDRATIVVTNEFNTRIYVPLQDYTTIKNGDFTELLIRPLGGIPIGSTINVAYWHDLEGRGEVLTLSERVEVELVVKDVVEFSVDWEHREQEALSGIPTSELELFERWGFETILTWRGLVLGGSYGEQESRIADSSEQIRLWGSYYAQPFGNWSTSISAQYSDFDFGDGGRAQQSIDAQMAVRGPVLSRGYLELAAEYRQEMWDAANAANDLKAYDVTMDFEWVYRLMTLEMDARARWIEQIGQEDQDYRVEMKIRREF